jgi:Zn-dependent peptidase ImmA (M78 family)
MKLPKKLKILGRPFIVEYKDFEKLVQHNGMSGNCTGHKQLIQIDSSNPRERQENTLLHEIIHLISDDLSLEFSEETVKRITTGLYQVLNDNGFLKEK